MLNLHPDVAFGLERYKFSILLRGELDAGMFQRQRFFAPQASETNLLPERFGGVALHYKALEDKFDAVKVVGDKIPHIAKFYPEIRECFSDARVIHLVREPTAVARSWERRAADPDDPWKAHVGAVTAIRRWMNENRLAMRFHREFPKSISIISYEGLFGEDSTTLEHAHEFLGISAPTEKQLVAQAEGAAMVGGKKFGELGPKPEGVEPARWEKLELMMRRLHNRIAPRRGPFVPPKA